jgi:hypothetical protein
MQLINTLNPFKPSIYPENPDFSDAIKNKTFYINSSSVYCRAAIITLGMTIFAPIELVLLAAFPIFRAVAYLDVERAFRALDQRAIKIILGADPKVPVASQVKGFLEKNPSSIRLLANGPKCPPELKNVTFEDGTTIMNLVLSLRKHARHTEEYKAKFELFKKIAQTDQDIKEVFSQLMLDFFSCDFDEPLIYLLENDLVYPDQFTENEISHFWSKVNDHRVAKLMFLKNFNIEAKGDDGLTPLQRVLLPSDQFQSDLSKTAILLLAHHAILPSLSEKVRYYHNGKMIKTTYNESLRVPKELIQYAIETQDMQGTGISSFPTTNPSLWNFLKPAISIDGTQDTFYKNYVTIASRAMMLGITSAVTTILILVSTSVTLTALPIIVGLGFTFLANHIENKRANSALDKMAFEAYQKRFVLPGVCDYVLENSSVLQKLSSEKCNLTKPDASGQTLWARAISRNRLLSKISMDTVRILAQSFFPDCSTPLTDTQFQNFIAALDLGREDIVRYLLGRLNHGQFNSEQLKDIWKHINTNPKMVAHFVDAGFEFKESDD